jgi:hypothetical protein
MKLFLAPESAKATARTLFMLPLKRMRSPCGALDAAAPAKIGEVGSSAVVVAHG